MNTGDMSLLDKAIKNFEECKAAYAADQLDEHGIYERWEELLFSVMLASNTELSKSVIEVWRNLLDEMRKIDAYKRGDHLKSAHQCFVEEQVRIFDFSNHSDSYISVLMNKDFTREGVMYFANMYALGCAFPH